MITGIIISILTCIALVLSIIFKPSIIIFKRRFDTFWIVASIGALLVLLTGSLPIKVLVNNLTTNTSINPLKIIILLLSLTMLSITLDEVGFFEHIAAVAIQKTNGSKYKLFFIFYALTAVLTIFTSNDIVILTFTLFICYFSKSAKINPIPYLVMEFVTANTYSMFFIIGNPTNIYIASFFNITFIEYFKVMWLPTILAGATSLALLLLMFKKDLMQKMDISSVSVTPIKHHTLSIVACLHLILCTVLLAISNYVKLEMWLITLVFAISLTIVLGAYTIVSKDLRTISHVYKRLPYTLCFFVIAMYTIVLTIDYYGITSNIALLFDNLAKVDAPLLSKIITTFIYGFASTITDNLINNIPMSLGFASILENATINTMHATFATIIGSNIGAYLTPIGALAGIMWIRILKEEHVPMGFKGFIKYSALLSIPVLVMALVSLLITL